MVSVNGGMNRGLKHFWGTSNGPDNWTECVCLIDANFTEELESFKLWLCLIGILGGDLCVMLVTVKSARDIKVGVGLLRCWFLIAARHTTVGHLPFRTLVGCFGQEHYSAGGEPRR